MQQCAEHMEYQLPNSHTQVSYLLDSIQCSDAGLQAAMASMRTDDGPQGMRNDFESAAANPLPYDPIAKKHVASGNKRGLAQISSVGGDEPEKVTMSGAAISKTKSSIGSTGVHLRYRTPEEYDKGCQNNIFQGQSSNQETSIICHCQGIEETCQTSEHPTC